MLVSQNGWAVSLDKKGIFNYDVDGANRHFSTCILGAPVLLGFAGELHKIEAIDTGTYDDWGWNPAKIPNSNDYSNHASGTAIDVNATKHGWKAVRSGYTSAQEKAIDALCAKYGLRWGWRYKFGFKDPMHFEIVETPAQVTARIARLKLPMPKLSK